MLAFGQRPPKLHSFVESLRAAHPGAPRFAPGETPRPPPPFAGGDDRVRGIGAEPACRGRDHCGNAAVPARVTQRAEVAPTNDASRFRGNSVSRSDSTIAAGTSPDAGSIRGVTREVTHAAVTAGRIWGARPDDAALRRRGGDSPTRPPLPRRHRAPPPGHARPARRSVAARRIEEEGLNRRRWVGFRPLTAPVQAMTARDGSGRCAVGSLGSAAESIAPLGARESGSKSGADAQRWGCSGRR